MSTSLVILCGGLSTRMGCDKVFLPFGDMSLLNYQVNRFRPYFEKIYISVPSHAERPIDYTAHCGCPVVEDRYSNIGPIGGIFSCLSEIDSEILFFTSVDAPFTDPELAAKLCEKLESDPDENHLFSCIADSDGRIQPLFAAYKKKSLTLVKALIDMKDYRLGHLFTEDNSVLINVSLPEKQFFNMNDTKAYNYGLQQLSES